MGLCELRLRDAVFYISVIVVCVDIWLGIAWVCIDLLVFTCVLNWFYRFVGI